MEPGGKLAEGLTGDIRPVSELYDYWCFFLLRRLLAEICQAELPDNGSFLSFTHEGLQVRLVKGKRSRLTFMYRQEAGKTVKVALFYNRRLQRPSRNLLSWKGSYSAAFDPDYSIAVTVTEGAAVQKHWLHFDAKYRLELAEVVQLLHDSGEDMMADAGDDEAGYEQEISRLHRREDLFKMQTYRDGILSTRGAYILFPGDGAGMRLDGKTQNFFIRHPSAFRGPAAYLHVLFIRHPSAFRGPAAYLHVPEHWRFRSLSGPGRKPTTCTESLFEQRAGSGRDRQSVP